MSEKAMATPATMIDEFPSAFRTQNRTADNHATATLAAAITKAASKQTYYTVRFLVDRERVADAYRAYAYFRWVDDQLDAGGLSDPARLTFVNRQQALLAGCYRVDYPQDLTSEEMMLVDLVRGDREPDSRLQSYLRHMMAVMAFDAERRGRLISEPELADYARLLATAVTEALHHFIGHDCPPPCSETRYLAATGAHITHMLRDTLEDAALGYYNVPEAYLAAHGIGPLEIDSPPYRAWVRQRVQLAQDCFRAGRDYLSQVGSLRCRLAGYAYIARFAGVLDIIEREEYRLRHAYPETRTLPARLGLGWASLWQGLTQRPRRVVDPPLRPGVMPPFLTRQGENR